MTLHNITIHRVTLYTITIQRVVIVMLYSNSYNVIYY